ncbi:MAG: hypothetical protein LBI82_08110 [Dysgonamonadaceae bacterium]|jgi:hypothetical protein|nr:hypothetical protein [Dysgonamonadaceae bacterium]
MKTKQFFVTIAIICIAFLFSVNLAHGYYPISPYAYCANNPINAIDPDGRDIVVINNPNGAQSAGKNHGHTAILVGNDKTGWTYISKDGRQKDQWYSNELTGGPSLSSDKKFKTINEFFNDGLSGGYTQNVRFSTDAIQDDAAKSKSLESAKSWYNAIFNNCADVVSEGLKAVGLDPGYIYVDSDDGIKGSLPSTPNSRFNQIENNNKEKIIPTLPENPNEEKK